MGNQALDFLGALTSPIPSADFLNEHWGRKLTHIQGPPDKFDDLFSWDQLNVALERYPTDPSRLRLFRSGKEIDPLIYTAFERLGHNVEIRKLNAGALTEELRNGATLVFNRADEASMTLRDLCVGLEDIFGSYVIANLYAALRSDNGFPLHWDDQDTFILQVSGQKQWTVFEPTVENSVQGMSHKPEAPTGAPVWEGRLMQGELLHIPRGWWHIAYPVDQPSLHLTVTVHPPTGIDLLRWYLKVLTESPSVRASIPLHLSSEHRRSFSETLAKAFSDMWTPDIVERFIDDRKAMSVPRPRVRLPGASD